jgi:hypothetical protein
MKSKYFITILMLAVFVLPHATSFGQAVSIKELTVNNDDVYQTILGRTGEYNPCCQWMTWLDKFSRTNYDPETPYHLEFQYTGVGLHHYYYSANYEHGHNYSFTGTLQISLDPNHEIIISKSSQMEHGAWSGMYAKAVYFDQSGQ